MKKYIHYGSDHFDKEKFSSYKKGDYMDKYKPVGFWASPVDAEWGWKDWCEREIFHLERLEKNFEFTLAPSAKILTLHTLEEAEPYIIEDPDGFSSPFLMDYILDSQRIYEEFDGMELVISDDYGNFHNTMVFFVWDVDSIVIWNPDIIIPV